MSYVIKEIDHPIFTDNPQYANIVELTERNAKELSMYIFDESNALFDYLVTKEVVRVMYLISELGTYHKRLIVIESEETKKIVGYVFISILHDPINLNPINEASIISIVVDEAHRRKGLMRIMIDEMKSIFSGIAITCSPSKTGIYQKMGFALSGSFQAHLCMTFGEVTADAKTIAIDDETVIAEPHVKNAMKVAIRRYGEDQIERANQELMTRFFAASREAESIYGNT